MQGFLESDFGKGWYTGYFHDNPWLLILILCVKLNSGSRNTLVKYLKMCDTGIN